MDQIANYIKPELAIVAVVCYIIGAALKSTTLLRDKYIPLALGGISVVLCTVWVCATSTMTNPQEVLTAVFTAITQCILLAGASTYINQIIKQSKKED